MLLIVGLGNPGKKYEKTRHNIGSRAINELEAFSFKNVILARPATFMNESGQAVKKLVRNLKIETKKLIILHDDLDLPLGKIRIVKNRGSAGHKGVESIVKELKTKNFIRFRIGIKPECGKPKNPEKFVLQNFDKKEEKTVAEAIKKTSRAMECFLEKGLEKTMNEFNK